MTVDLGSDVDARAERATRGRVLKWTPRSRNRMIDKLRTLDYRPLFENGGHPAMVTLTMVGRSEAHGDHTWIEVAPDGEAYARMIELLQGRFWKSWGYRMPGVWKREFQERGAPHTHILMTPPRGRSRGDGMEFPLWLSMHWASIQRYQGQTPEEFAKTVANSTSIDYDKGLRGYDAARVTQYFGKHGAWAAKDYQNNPPKAWQERNKVGRFWGYWQLRPIEGVAMFGPAEEAASPQRWWGKGKSVPESPIMHIMSTSRRHLRV